MLEGLCLIPMGFLLEFWSLESELIRQIKQDQASLVAQRLKRLPTMQETRVQSLGQEDPLEKEMATHSSILAWRIPWTEEPGRLQSMESQSQTRLSDFTSPYVFLNHLTYNKVCYHFYWFSIFH